ncbi:MAG TPA: hypothetical protein VGM56_23430 [Byssovorax sp.]|jgi:hypothetical protein
MTRTSRIRNVIGPRAALALAVLLGSSAACSFLVQTRSEQCEIDADCTQFNGGNAHCDLAQHVCEPGPPCDDHGGTCVCNPTTNDDLLNACTDAPCIPFAESRLTKLVNGELPPVPDASIPFTPQVFDAGTIGTSCDDLPGSKVYIVGPKSLKPFLTAIGPHLAQKNNISIVFQQTTSCDSLEAMIDQTTTLGRYGGGVSFNVDDTGGAGTPCDVLPKNGSLPLPDIGSSETFAESCFPSFTAYPKTIVELQGPVEAMSFVTAIGSDETVISREAAYFVYGFGKNSGVAPWTDPTTIFQRDPTSGTENVIAETIGVPTRLWRGQNTQSTGDETSKLQALDKKPAAANTLGEMASNEAELAPDGGLNKLAYQHTGQTCGYYPNSGTDPDAGDKDNVRDGHYAAWGPLHLAYRVDTSGTASNKDALTIINLITGVSVDPEIDLVKAAADARLIPQCAMHVQRKSGDGTDMSPFKPDVSCSCYFDKLTKGSTSCTTCSTTTDCDGVAGAPNCHFGYCEP